MGPEGGGKVEVARRGGRVRPGRTPGGPSFPVLLEDGSALPGPGVRARAVPVGVRPDGEPPARSEEPRDPVQGTGLVGPMERIRHDDEVEDALREGGVLEGGHDGSTSTSRGPEALAVVRGHAPVRVDRRETEVPPTQHLARRDARARARPQLQHPGAGTGPTGGPQGLVDLLGASGSPPSVALGVGPVDLTARLARELRRPLTRGAPFDCLNGVPRLRTRPFRGRRSRRPSRRPRSPADRSGRAGASGYGPSAAS